ncbi:MAG: S9 family peptidase, partial [Bryobacteraceae bacterium]
MRWKVSLFLLIAVLCAGTAASGQNTAKKPVTIDAMLAHRRFEPISPIWRPDGKAFAYDEKGTMRLYNVSTRTSRVWFQTDALRKAAKPPVKPRQHNWQDRDVAPKVYQWFPNNKDLLAWINDALFIVHPNGKFKRLKAVRHASEAKLSPNGKLVLYRVKSNLYVLDLVTHKTRQLTSDGTATLLNGKLDWVYPEELDLPTAMWWSPDSKKIAYLQFNVSDEFEYPHADLLGRRAVSEPERYPQAGTPNALVKLGVVSTDGGKTVWMKAGDSPDVLLARVKWLPDSSAVALERLDRVQNRLDLLFCNPATGAVRRVIHEQSKTWINVTNNLYFLKSQPEFLWTSERSGFRHLYRYSDNGKLLGQVTSGNWEVRSIAAVDEAHREIYFTSSEQSPLETQLYRVGLDGGARTLLTAASYTHTIHANKSGSYYLDTYSSLKQPTETVLRSASGNQIAVLQPQAKKQLKIYDILPSEIVKVKAPDGTVLYGRLIKPAGFRKGVKYPAIVHVYGGPGFQTVRNQWYGIDWDQVLAHHGYVVWHLDNRGTYGRGHAFEAVV